MVTRSLKTGISKALVQVFWTCCWNDNKSILILFIKRKRSKLRNKCCRGSGAKSSNSGTGPRTTSRNFDDLDGAISCRIIANKLSSSTLTSFLPRAIILWNSLPADLQLLTTSNSFKSALKKYLKFTWLYLLFLWNTFLVLSYPYDTSFFLVPPPPPCRNVAG